MTSAPPNLDAAPQGGFIDAIVEIARTPRAHVPTLGEILDALDDRAFGLSILLLAIPCLVPGLPGAQLIALPIFLLSAQVALGRREPWLPGFLMRANVKPAVLNAAADFATKRLRWMERVSRRRWRKLSGRVGERVTGFAMALASITIMLPIANTVPSLAITLAAVGLLQRDGRFMLAGTLIALIWIGLICALTIGLMTGAGFAVDLIQRYAPWMPLP